MEYTETLWTEKLELDQSLAKQDSEDHIIAFVKKIFEEKELSFQKIDFLGVVFGDHQLSVRVPSPVEIALSQICEAHDDRYVFSNLQRLHLVDERRAGLDKLITSCRAFDSKKVLLCWYGKDSFEVLFLEFENP